VMRVLHLWLAEPLDHELPIRAYVGSVRFCAGWYSYRELVRLFRRASTAAVGLGLSARLVRNNLAAFLRDYFAV
jgi:hypothetical protein